MHKYSQRVKWKLVTNAGGMACDSSTEVFGIRADEDETSKEEKTLSWENLSWTREEGLGVTTVVSTTEKTR